MPPIAYAEAVGLARQVSEALKIQPKQKPRHRGRGRGRRRLPQVEVQDSPFSPVIEDLLPAVEALYRHVGSYDIFLADTYQSITEHQEAIAEVERILPYIGQWLKTHQQGDLLSQLQRLVSERRMALALTVKKQQDALALTIEKQQDQDSLDLQAEESSTSFFPKYAALDKQASSLKSQLLEAREAQLEALEQIVGEWEVEKQAINREYTGEEWRRRTGKLRDEKGPVKEKIIKQILIINRALAWHYPPEEALPLPPFVTKYAVYLKALTEGLDAPFDLEEVTSADAETYAEIADILQDNLATFQAMMPCLEVIEADTEAGCAELSMMVQDHYVQACEGLTAEEISLLERDASEQVVQDVVKDIVDSVVDAVQLDFEAELGFEPQLDVEAAQASTLRLYQLEQQLTLAMGREGNTHLREMLLDNAFSILAELGIGEVEEAYGSDGLSAFYDEESPYYELFQAIKAGNHEPGGAQAQEAFSVLLAIGHEAAYVDVIAELDTHARDIISEDRYVDIVSLVKDQGVAGVINKFSRLILNIMMDDFVQQFKELGVSAKDLMTLNLNSTEPEGVVEILRSYVRELLGPELEEFEEIFDVADLKQRNTSLYQIFNMLINSVFSYEEQAFRASSREEQLRQFKESVEIFKSSSVMRRKPEAYELITETVPELLEALVVCEARCEEFSSASLLRGIKGLKACSYAELMPKAQAILTMLNEFEKVIDNKKVQVPDLERQRLVLSLNQLYLEFVDVIDDRVAFVERNAEVVECRAQHQKITSKLDTDINKSLNTLVVLMNAYHRACRLDSDIQLKTFKSIYADLGYEGVLMLMMTTFQTDTPFHQLWESFKESVKHLPGEERQKEYQKFISSQPFDKELQSFKETLGVELTEEERQEQIQNYLIEKLEQQMKVFADVHADELAPEQARMFRNRLATRMVKALSSVDRLDQRKQHVESKHQLQRAKLEKRQEQRQKVIPGLKSLRSQLLKELSPSRVRGIQVDEQMKQAHRESCRQQEELFQIEANTKEATELWDMIREANIKLSSMDLSLGDLSVVDSPEYLIESTFTQSVGFARTLRALPHYADYPPSPLVHLADVHEMFQQCLPKIEELTQDRMARAEASGQQEMIFEAYKAGWLFYQMAEEFYANTADIVQRAESQDYVMPTLSHQKNRQRALHYAHLANENKLNYVLDTFNQYSALGPVASHHLFDKRLALLEDALSIIKELATRSRFSQVNIDEFLRLRSICVTRIADLELVLNEEIQKAETPLDALPFRRDLHRLGSIEHDFHSACLDILEKAKDIKVSASVRHKYSNAEKDSAFYKRKHETKRARKETSHWAKVREVLLGRGEQQETDEEHLRDIARLAKTSLVDGITVDMSELLGKNMALLMQSTQLREAESRVIEQGKHIALHGVKRQIHSLAFGDETAEVTGIQPASDSADERARITGALLSTVTVAALTFAGMGVLKSVLDEFVGKLVKGLLASGISTLTGEGLTPAMMKDLQESFTFTPDEEAPEEERLSEAEAFTGAWRVLAENPLVLPMILVSAAAVAEAQARAGDTAAEKMQAYKEQVQQQSEEYLLDKERLSPEEFKAKWASSRAKELGNRFQAFVGTVLSSITEQHRAEKAEQSMDESELVQRNIEHASQDFYSSMRLVMALEEAEKVRQELIDEVEAIQSNAPQFRMLLRRYHSTGGAGLTLTELAAVNDARAIFKLRVITRIKVNIRFNAILSKTQVGLPDESQVENMERTTELAELEVARKFLFDEIQQEIKKLKKGTGSSAYKKSILNDIVTISTIIRDVLRKQGKWSEYDEERHLHFLSVLHSDISTTVDKYAMPEQTGDFAPGLKAEDYRIHAHGLFSGTKYARGTFIGFSRGHNVTKPLTFNTAFYKKIQDHLERLLIGLEEFLTQEESEEIRQAIQEKMSYIRSQQETLSQLLKNKKKVPELKLKALEDFIDRLADDTPAEERQGEKSLIADLGEYLLDNAVIKTNEIIDALYPRGDRRRNKMLAAANRVVRIKTLDKKITELLRVLDEAKEKCSRFSSSDRALKSDISQLQKSLTAIQTIRAEKTRLSEKLLEMTESELESHRKELVEDEVDKCIDFNPAVLKRYAEYATSRLRLIKERARTLTQRIKNKRQAVQSLTDMTARGHGMTELSSNQAHRKIHRWISVFNSRHPARISATQKDIRQQLAEYRAMVKKQQALSVLLQLQPYIENLALTEVVDGDIQTVVNTFLTEVVSPTGLTKEERALLSSVEQTLMDAGIEGPFVLSDLQAKFQSGELSKTSLEDSIKAIRSNEVYQSFQKLGIDPDSFPRRNSREKQEQLRLQALAALTELIDIPTEGTFTIRDLCKAIVGLLQRGELSLEVRENLQYFNDIAPLISLFNELGFEDAAAETDVLQAFKEPDGVLCAKVITTQYLVHLDEVVIGRCMQPLLESYKHETGIWPDFIADDIDANHAMNLLMERLHFTESATERAKLINRLNQIMMDADKIQDETDREAFLDQIESLAENNDIRGVIRPAIRAMRHIRDVLAIPMYDGVDVVDLKPADVEAYILLQGRKVFGLGQYIGQSNEEVYQNLVDRSLHYDHALTEQQGMLQALEILLMVEGNNPITLNLLLEQQANRQANTLEIRGDDEARVGALDIIYQLLAADPLASVQAFIDKVKAHPQFVPNCDTGSLQFVFAKIKETYGADGDYEEKPLELLRDKLEDILRDYRKEDISLGIKYIKQRTRHLQSDQSHADRPDAITQDHLAELRKIKSWPKDQQELRQRRLEALSQYKEIRAERNIILEAAEELGQAMLFHDLRKAIHAKFKRQETSALFVNTSGHITGEGLVFYGRNLPAICRVLSKVDFSEVGLDIDIRLGLAELMSGTGDLIKKIEAFRKRLYGISPSKFSILVNQFDKSEHREASPYGKSLVIGALMSMLAHDSRNVKEWYQLYYGSQEFTVLMPATRDIGDYDRSTDGFQHGFARDEPFTPTNLERVKGQLQSTLTREEARVQRQRDMETVSVKRDLLKAKISGLNDLVCLYLTNTGVDPRAIFRKTSFACDKAMKPKLKKFISLASEDMLSRKQSEPLMVLQKHKASMMSSIKQVLSEAQKTVHQFKLFTTARLIKAAYDLNIVLDKLEKARISGDIDFQTIRELSEKRDRLQNLLTNPNALVDLLDEFRDLDPQKLDAEIKNLDTLQDEQGELFGESLRESGDFIRRALQLISGESTSLEAQLAIDEPSQQQQDEAELGNKLLILLESQLDINHTPSEDIDEVLSQRQQQLEQINSLIMAAHRAGFTIEEMVDALRVANVNAPEYYVALCSERENLIWPDSPQAKVATGVELDQPAPRSDHHFASVVSERLGVVTGTRLVASTSKEFQKRVQGISPDSVESRSSSSPKQRLLNLGSQPTYGDLREGLESSKAHFSRRQRRTMLSALKQLRPRQDSVSSHGRMMDVLSTVSSPSSRRDSPVQQDELYDEEERVEDSSESLTDAQIRRRMYELRKAHRSGWRDYDPKMGQDKLEDNAVIMGTIGLFGDSATTDGEDPFIDIDFPTPSPIGRDSERD